MPDLLAGTPITALDFPPTVVDTQDDLFTFDATTFGVDADTGTYADCAVAFMAPTSGRVAIDYAGELDASTSAVSCNMAPYVREGATIGAGADVQIAEAQYALRNVGTDSRAGGRRLVLEGLTPGDEYNVRLEHRCSGGTGTIQYRHLSVSPLP
jgi:hypothetical protein